MGTAKVDLETKNGHPFTLAVVFYALLKQVGDLEKESKINDFQKNRAVCFIH